MDDSLDLSVPILEAKNTPKKCVPVWINRPYKVWRTNFQEDRCCSKKNLGIELVTASYPIISLNLALFLYIIFGSHLFLNIEEVKNPPRNHYELVLFCFTTISTIGYGDIYPETFTGKIVCMLYCFIGIPLLFTTISTNGFILVDVYNVINQSINVKAKPRKDLPWFISLILLISHCLLGAFFFSFGDMDLSFISALYFSFVSISTIGFGDICLKPKTFYQTFIYIMFLSTGIGILSTFFGTLQKVVLWMHNIGRKLSNSGDAEIWFGGKMMTVRELVVIIADHFQCTPEQLREVLHDLDQILEVACQQTEDNNEQNCTIEECTKLLTLNDGSSTPKTPITNRKKTVYLHVDKGIDIEDTNQLTVHSFAGSHQRTLPKNTELAIQALGAIQHTLRKPSTRARPGHSRSNQQSIQTLFPSKNELEPNRKVGTRVILHRPSEEENIPFVDV